MIGKNNFQEGQILLIVILIMVTALTVGLSVAARSITSLRTTVEEENSERAFSAAEAGIEQALQSLGSSSTNAGGFTRNNSSFETVVKTLSGQELLLNNGSPLLKDDSGDIWLSKYPDFTSPWTGNITIYWGNQADVCDNNESDNTMAALNVFLLTGPKDDPKMESFALDPCPARAAVNKFSFVPAASYDISGKTFRYSKTFNINPGLLMRIIPLYSPAVIGIRSCDAAGNNCNDLPSQGVVIESLGKSDTSQRKIVTYRSFPRLPTEIFPFVMFSAN